MQADGFHNSPFGQGGDSDSERSLKLNDRKGFYQSINMPTFIIVLLSILKISIQKISKLKTISLFDKIPVQGTLVPDTTNSV